MTAENPLNVRVAYTRAETRKNGDNYTKEIVTVESDKPESLSVPDALDGLKASVNLFFQPKPQGPLQEQPKQATPASPPPFSKEELAAIPFQSMPSKPEGYWAFADKPESKKLAGLLAQRPDRTLILSQYKLTLSKDGKFLNRWPHRTAEASA